MDRPSAIRQQAMVGLGALHIRVLSNLRSWFRQPAGVVDLSADFRIEVVERQQEKRLPSEGVTMADVSRRARDLGTENAFVVLAEVNELIREGRDVISFCIGQPDFHTPANIQEAAVRAIREGRHGYTPSAGIPELRQAAAENISRSRGIQVMAEDVVVGAGAKPFIGYAVLSVTDFGAGDEVIYPNPGFPIYESQIKACGAVGVPIHLREGRGFSFDPGELAEKITRHTRLLILNSPHNPTGGIIARKDMETLAKILLGHEQVWVYADEIYSRLVYEGEFVSIASMPGMQERTIISDGCSKTWAMTGWRLGFAANRKLAPYFTNWVTNTESCASQISQWAALEALTGPQVDADRMRHVFLERRNLIVELLNQVPGVACQSPGGAFYVWPNVTEACRMIGAENSEELRSRLLYEAGVAVLADIHFGPRVPGEGQHIRFSYAASNDAIREGISRMADFVQKNTL
jgi:aspartate aminotransferase